MIPNTQDTECMENTDLFFIHKVKGLSSFNEQAKKINNVRLDCTVRDADVAKENMQGNYE